MELFFRFECVVGLNLRDACVILLLGVLDLSHSIEKGKPFERMGHL